MTSRSSDSGRPRACSSPAAAAGARPTSSSRTTSRRRVDSTSRRPTSTNCTRRGAGEPEGAGADVPEGRARPSTRRSRSQVVALLVQQAELAAEAEKLGITVTDTAVQTRLDQIKKQYFAGSEKKYQAQLKEQGFTDAQVRGQGQGAARLEQALFDKVTKDGEGERRRRARLLPAAPRPSTSSRPRGTCRRSWSARTSRRSRTQIYAQLQEGAELRRAREEVLEGHRARRTRAASSRPSRAPTSPSSTTPCSLRGQDEQLSKPVNSSQYGWFVIKPVADIEPGKTTTEKEVAATIRTQLLQEQAEHGDDRLGDEHREGLLQGRRRSSTRRGLPAVARPVRCADVHGATATT